MERRVGAAVVHERPGVFGLELVDEGLAWLDGAHLVVPGDLAGVEVDGVADRPVVDQGDDEDVADLAAQGRAGHGAVEGPHHLGDPGGDLDLGLDGVQGELVVGAARRRSQGRVVGSPARRRLGLEIDRSGLVRGIVGPVAGLPRRVARAGRQGCDHPALARSGVGQEPATRPGLVQRSSAGLDA
jgi:hypothetical protein